MKPEDKKTFLISAGMIILLSLLSFYRLQNFDPSAVVINYPSPETIDLPDLDVLFSQERLSEISRDMGLSVEEGDVKYIRKEVADLRFDYPSHWEEVNPPPEDKILMLFAAVSRDPLSPKAATVFLLDVENIDDAASALEEELRKSSSRVEISTEKKGENEYFFLSESSDSGGMTSTTKAKIIFLEDKCYVAGVTFFKEQNLFPGVTEYILSSVQIIVE